jgi:DNA repair exonuclease SbcCD ATPase subunit
LDTFLRKEMEGADDHEKFVNLCKTTYKEQSVWFLNAFWNDLGEKEAERMWEYVQKCSQIDLENKEEGSGLDEMMAHRFLEEFGETLTVPITHYLTFKYGYDWHTLVNATQGDNQEELKQAQQMLNEVNRACKEAEEAASAARIAQNELNAALNALHEEEASYNGKIEDATKRSQGGGVVSMNKAKAELAQLQAEDPLPLRRAKITTEAAVKKAEKTKRAAEETLEEVKRRVEEAEAYLKKVKAQCGSAQGGIWWIERDLHEAKKYMPTAKGGIRK